MLCLMAILRKAQGFAQETPLWIQINLILNQTFLSDFFLFKCRLNSIKDSLEKKENKHKLKKVIV